VQPSRYEFPDFVREVVVSHLYEWTLECWSP
jgi:hypothetical protein